VLITLFIVLYMQDVVERVRKTDDEREAALFATEVGGVIYVLAPSAVSALGALALALAGGSV